MLTFHVTPRGFSVPMKELFEEIEKEGLPATDNFLHYIQTKPVNGINFHLAVMDQVKSILSYENKLSLRTWIEFFIDNPNPKMGYLHYSFLLETIGFIETGFRRVSPVTMTALLNSQPDADKKVPAHQDAFKEIKQKLVDRLKTLSYDTDNNFLYYWVSQRDGFTDLIYTLQLIYGK